MREDISDFNMEKIYRQLASFLLQLFKLDFDRIGSLPSPYPETQGSSTLARPLTFKVHTILQNGSQHFRYVLLPSSPPLVPKRSWTAEVWQRRGSSRGVLSFWNSRALTAEDKEDPDDESSNSHWDNIQVQVHMSSLHVILELWLTSPRGSQSCRKHVAGACRIAPRKFGLIYGAVNFVKIFQPPLSYVWQSCEPCPSVKGNWWRCSVHLWAGIVNSFLLQLV